MSLDCGAMFQCPEAFGIPAADGLIADVLWNLKGEGRWKEGIE